MTTPRLGAPELATSQTNKEETVNEQIRYIESGAGHFVFKSRATIAPPGSPADGDCYFIASGSTPTGAWAGKAGKIAFLVNTSWEFITPIDGFTAVVVDESRLFVGYNSSTGVWDTLSAPSGTYQPLDADLTALAGLTSAANKIPYFTGSGAADLLTLDTDGTLAGDSDTKLATQKAVKTYVDTAVTGLLDLKGTTDCSAKPNYPAASKGDYYVVTVAGKIGGAGGTTVAVGDVYFAVADNAGGTQASVGSSWDILVHASVAAGGGLLAANNLSDVANASTARANLGAAAHDPSIQPVTSSATVTPTFSDDQVNITAQAAGLTLANPTGTAVPAWGIVIRIKDNGTARSISYGTQYRAIGVTLPTTTVISKTLYLAMIYNSTDTKWDVVAVAQEA